MNIHRSLTGAERAKRWRAKMYAKGLKPKTFWLPDTSSPKFKEQARRDCEALTRWYEENPEILEELWALQDPRPDDQD